MKTAAIRMCRKAGIKIVEEKVKISVIMSVFNPVHQRRFEKAVESIVQQTFKDWELLLYDDGSAAPFDARIRQVAQLDDRILYLRGNENKGLGGALNVCIQRAAGEYIARMDDDDFSRPDRLERQYAFLQAHPAYQWVGSNAELRDAKGIWGYQKMPEKPEKRDFLFNSPFIHPSVLFRRDTLRRVNGYLASKKFLLCEDYELFMRLYQNGYKGYNIQEPLLQYWEDYASYQKRTYRRRIREMRLRYHGFQNLSILNHNTFYYVLKPLVAGVIPAPVHHYIQRKVKRSKKIGGAKS